MPSWELEGCCGLELLYAATLPRMAGLVLWVDCLKPLGICFGSARRTRQSCTWTRSCSIALGMPFGCSELRMPLGDFGGLLWAGAALCSYLTRNGGAGPMSGLFKPLSICFGGAGGLNSSALELALV